MNEKNFKRIAAAILAVLITFGSTAGVKADVPDSRTILVNTETSEITENTAVKLPDMRLTEYQVDKLSVSTLSAIRNTSSVDYNLADSVWAGDGSDYYFSKLTTNEKNLYLSLKQASDAYMTGTGSFLSTKVNRNGESVKIYILPQASYSGMTTAQMRRVVNCFLFENPQYYFLRNAIVYSEKSEVVSIGLYANFANGSKRASYTNKFETQLETWEAQIAEAGTVVQKERLIHDLICESVTYNNNIDLNDPDDMQMSQSCISAVLFDRSTVCAGYAQLFTLLCNRSDIQCVTVTSTGHAWNKVRLGNVWYNVDCTWDDYDGGFTTTYFNVTDAQIQRKDTVGEHTAGAEWDNLAPSCTDLFSEESANMRMIVSNITAPEKMIGITALGQKKGYISISFKAQNGSDGYVVQYASDKSMNQTKKKTISSTKCEITGLISGKTYYVRIRAYTLDSLGRKLYGAYSNILKVTVK